MKLLSRAIFALVFFTLFTTSASAAKFRQIRNATQGLRWDQSTLLGGFIKTTNGASRILRIPSPQGKVLELPLWQASKSREPAGLWIVFPGTGSNPEENLANYVAEKAARNYDAIVLPNPFSTSFQETFSSDALIGFPQKDLPDVIRMINAAYLAYTRVRGEPRSVNLLGISLGGLYTILLEQQERRLDFRFSRFLAVNPPVHLRNSVKKIDDMVRFKLRDGEANHIKTIFSYLLPLFLKITEKNYDIGSKSLAELRALVPEDESKHKAIIGGAFQRWLAPILKGLTRNPAFQPGYQRERIAQMASSITFERYMGLVGVHLPEPLNRKTFDELERELNLERVFSHSKRPENIYVIHTMDDFLLSPGDLETVESALGSNLLLFSSGGHCGEIWTPEFWKLVFSLEKK